MPIRTIEIPEELDSFVAGCIASGEYADANQVLKEALTLLKHEDENDAFKTYELRKAIQEGFASGEAEGSTDEVFARVREKAGLPVRTRA